VQSYQKQLYDNVSDSLAGGNLREAISACRELNARFPEYFDGWRIAGEIHIRLKKYEPLLVSTERALALMPGDISVSLQRLDGLLALEREQEARELLRTLADTATGSADMHDRIGRLMASLEMHEESLAQYVKALSYEPENASLYYNVATAQRFLGNIEAAERSVDKLLKINEFDFEAQAMRSSLRKQTAASNHIDELQRVLASPRLAEEGKVHIRYALAKEYDDIDQPQRSFDFLKSGADERRAGMNYEVHIDLDIMSEIRNTFDADFFRDHVGGYDSAEPIFIVGLPRTGTTLVERILGSHSAVHAAGELDNFGREMMRQLTERVKVKGLSQLQAIEQSAQLDFSRLGVDYINSTRPLTGHTDRFIDKLPFNYLYTGLIHLSLPNARIINVRRHPMAACYAIYKQLFRDAYPFSYDLKDLGRYYVAYNALMAHWHEVMPGVIHTIAYEDVVSNLEGEARELLNYCGLGWEAECLRFHENRQASTTASASQVRQPVYQSSVERWRTYRHELEPLEQILTDAGIDL
jgi:tetratricopeptide (TPR) repeat protein